MNGEEIGKRSPPFFYIPNSAPPVNERPRRSVTLRTVPNNRVGTVTSPNSNHTISNGFINAALVPSTSSNVSFDYNHILGTFLDSRDKNDSFDRFTQIVENTLGPITHWPLLRQAHDILQCRFVERMQAAVSAISHYQQGVYLADYLTAQTTRSSNGDKSENALSIPNSTAKRRAGDEEFILGKDHPKKKKADILAGYVFKDAFDLDIRPDLSKDDVVFHHEDFRIGNLRLAIQEMRNRMRRSTIGDIEEKIRRTLIFLFQQMISPANTVKYTFAERVISGMTKLPQDLAMQITRGICRCIQPKEDAVKYGFTKSKHDVPTSVWSEIIADRMEEVLRLLPIRQPSAVTGPSGNKKKLLVHMNDDEHWALLQTDSIAVNENWYEGVEEEEEEDD